MLYKFILEGDNSPIFETSNENNDIIAIGNEIEIEDRVYRITKVRNIYKRGAYYFGLEIIGVYVYIEKIINKNNNKENGIEMLFSKENILSIDLKANFNEYCDSKMNCKECELLKNKIINDESYQPCEQVYGLMKLI